MTNIHYKNYKDFEKIKSNFIDDGLSNLHILSDFDSTLTKLFDNWVRIPWIFQLIKEHNLLWKEFSRRWKILFEKYYPIEIDHKISNEEKKIFMQERWEKTFELLIEYWYNLEVVEYIWLSDFIKLRDGHNIFFDLLFKKNIPLTVISAAWTWKDSLERFFYNKLSYTENINIISNEFIRDDNWRMIWYKKPIIHTFNKEEIIPDKDINIYHKIKNKKSVILLWDSLWDPNMISWFEYKNLLKIWFLNQNEEILLDEYKKIYDVIITWDWTMWFINDFLSECFE